MNWPKDKQLVIVVFAGRSGSKSLTALLNAQPETCAIWENTGFHSIKAVNNAKARLEFLARQPYKVIADIDYRWVWHLRDVIKIPEAIIVYLHRNPLEIADSFANYLIEKTDSSVLSYPFLSIRKDRDTILDSVVNYQAEVMGTGQFFPDRIIRVELEQLNMPDKMDRLLNLLGCPKKGRLLELYNIRSWGSNSNELQYKEEGPSGGVVPNTK